MVLSIEFSRCSQVRRRSLKHSAQGDWRVGSLTGVVMLWWSLEACPSEKLLASNSELQKQRAGI